MIKTLQISSILAVIVAGVLFVSSVVFGVHEDEQIEEFLKSPGAKEQFLKNGRRPPTPNSEKSSPLVKEAERFSGILKPKPKPTPKIANIAKTDTPAPPPPPPLTAKYKLYGTVVSESDPKMSIALINEPGKGLLFVRQGTVIMGTTIEKVLDGKISVKDSRGTVEMTVEEGPAPVSASAGPPHAGGVPSARPPISTSASKTRITSGAPPRPAIPPRTAGGSGRRGPVTPESIRSRMTSQENARLSALSDRLKAAKDAKTNSGKTTAEIIAEEDAKSAEIMKKLSESLKKDAAERSKGSTATRPPTPRVPPTRSR